MDYKQYLSHIIQKGDTIYQLAQDYNMTVDEILAQNPALDPHNLQVGSAIMICSECSEE